MRVILIFLAILAGTPLSARAYVLEGRHILYLMLQEMNLPGSFTARQQVTQYDPNTGDVISTAVETARFRMPEAFRSETAADGLSRIHAASADRFITIIDDRVSGETGLWTDDYKNLFWYRSLERLEHFFTNCGLDVNVSSLGRFNGQIAFVVGDVYPSESASQLWVTRETFRPLRWIYQAKDPASGKTALEFRYGNWKPFGKTWFPFRIEFYQDNRLIRSIAVETLESASPAAELFDIDALRRAYGMDAPGAATREPESDIQRRIDDFKRIYE